MHLTIKNNTSHLLHPKLFRYLKMINWAITPLRHKRSLLVLELLMNIKWIRSGEEAMTLLNSVCLPPISIKARISLSAGRLEFLQFKKETQKRKLNLTCSFEKTLNEATMAWCRDEKIPWETKHSGGTSHSYCQYAMKYCLRMCKMTSQINAVKYLY